MTLPHASTIFAFTVGTVFMVAAVTDSAQDKATILRNARTAVEANMSTAAGKTYDEQFGSEFAQKHLEPLRQCKQTDGSDLTSFWMLFRLDKDGSVREMLLYPAKSVPPTSSYTNVCTVWFPKGTVLP